MLEFGWVNSDKTRSIIDYVAITKFNVKSLTLVEVIAIFTIAWEKDCLPKIKMKKPKRNSSDVHKLCYELMNNADLYKYENLEDIYCLIETIGYSSDDLLRFMENRGAKWDGFVNLLRMGV